MIRHPARGFLFGAIVLFISFTVAGYSVVVSLQSRARGYQTNCQEIEKLKALVVVTIQASDAAIDDFSLSSEAIARAHKRNAETIGRFSPREC